jgi:RimJ/RimL family protein N-acetyltransferase
VNARDYIVHDTLRDGSAVTIRAVRPEDRALLVAAFANLEQDSIYTRFFAFKQELSERDLAALDTMDFVSDVMVVATRTIDDVEVVIGSARYVELGASDGPRSAEVAFTVEEDYRGQGLARRLLASLVAIARSSGIARFEADVLPSNKAMLAVFERSGLGARRRREHDILHVTLELQPPPA